MRLVIVGASRFGLRCLELCRELPQIKLVGVVTAPRKFSISYRPQGVEMLYMRILRDMLRNMSSH